MHFTPILLLAAGVIAFTIPEGQPNGVYEVITAPDGTETHIFLRGLDDAVKARDTTTVAKKINFAHKRQVPGVDNSVGCGGYMLPSGDTDAANNALDAQCGGGANVPANRDFYSLSNCVVAYFCNLTGGGQFCFASERQEASAFITAGCGRYWAGWDHINSDARTGQYGYEDNCGRGSHFCGRGV